MMMRSVKRWVAIGLTAAVAAVGLEVATPVVAGATQVDLVCQGITGDNASSLGDSKATLGLLSTLSPGGGSGLTFSVDIGTNAPAKATPGAGPFNADFDLTITLPDSVVKPAKELLKLTSVKVKNATFAITASGAADAELATSLPELTVDLNQNPVTIQQRISGSIEPKRSGAIIYKPSTNTKMTIDINANVAGVQINSLTVTCSGSKEFATTAVQIPGSPNVTQPIYQVAYTASVVGRPLIGKDVTPDNGNPITTDSLALTSQAPNGGYSAVGGGAAFFLAPREPGLYNAQYNVCAASKTVPEVPGVNTVQTLTIPYAKVEGNFMNPHPIAMSLSFNGAKTAPISLGTDLFGNPSPTNANLLTNGDTLLGKFQAPGAGTIQSALEALPTIGKGNVAVTGSGPYEITFRNALGLSEQNKIEVVDFVSWLPADGLSTVIGALKPAEPKPGEPTTTTAKPKTQAELDAEFGTNVLTIGLGPAFEKWLNGRLDLLKGDIIAGATSPASLTAITSLFPKAPETVITTNGKPVVPQTETGPLCTAFTIGYFVIPNPFDTAVLGATQTRTVTKCSYVRVKSKGKYIKKKVCKKVAVKAATTKKK